MPILVAIMWILIVRPVAGDVAVPASKADAMKPFMYQAQTFGSQAECESYWRAHMLDILKQHGVPENVIDQKTEDYLRNSGTSEAGVQGHLKAEKQKLGLKDTDDLYLSSTGFSCDKTNL